MGESTRSTDQDPLVNENPTRKKKVRKVKATAPTPDGKLPITSPLFREMRFDAAVKIAKEFVKNPAAGERQL